MSCQSSLKCAGEIFSTEDEPVNLPDDYYIYTSLMIGLVVGIPLVYRQIWLAFWALLNYLRRPKHLRGGPAGCRPIGKLGHRNLSREHRLEERANGASSSKVEALFVYPIKSCYPVELGSSNITQTGFEYDRQFCFASWHEPLTKGDDMKTPPKKGSPAWWDSKPHWEFMTQRQYPSLTHLKVEIWVPDSKLPDYDEESEVVKSGGCLVVSFPFSPLPSSLRNIWSLIYAKLSTLNPSTKPIWRFQIPLNPTAEQIKATGYGVDTVRIWRDEPNGVDMSSEIPRHILTHLQMLFLEDIKRNSPHKYARMKCFPQLRLYRVDKSKHRLLYKCAPTEEQLGYQANVGYQDSYPIHLQNMASIMDAEKHIALDRAFEPDSRRYRANVYVSGHPAYDEDEWTFISIGSHELHVACRTTRCKLPTNDPDTGILGSDTQPYNYLVKNRAIDEGAPQSGCLGMMLVPTKDAVGSTIKIGDELKVLRRGHHFFVADTGPEAQRPVL